MPTNSPGSTTSSNWRVGTPERSVTSPVRMTRFDSWSYQSSGKVRSTKPTRPVVDTTKAARALASVGRWDEAKELASTHLDAARAFGARRSLGAALRAMADSTQDLDDRVNWLIESVKVLDESPARLEKAGAMIDLGVSLIERRDAETARTLFQQSATIALACRAQRLVEIANSHLRSLGSRPRQFEWTGMDSLTPAELRAVNLAAANVTNRALAGKL